MKGLVLQAGRCQTFQKRLLTLAVAAATIKMKKFDFCCYNCEKTGYLTPSCKPLRKTNKEGNKPEGCPPAKERLAVMMGASVLRRRLIMNRQFIKVVSGEAGTSNKLWHMTDWFNYWKELVQLKKRSWMKNPWYRDTKKLYWWILVLSSWNYSLWYAYLNSYRTLYCALR